MTARDARARVEQPAPAGSTDPTAPEIPADELAEAERYLRERTDPDWGDTPLVERAQLGRFMAEYDERGRELERLREIVRYMSEPDMEMATEFAQLRARNGAARAVVQAWKAWREKSDSNALKEAFDLLDALVRAHEDRGTDR